MKRALKWTVRVVVGLAALLLLVLLATLTTVDHTPYRGLPAWRETSTRLEQLRAATNVVFGELRAGFGRAKLTPALGAERDEPEQGRFRAVPLAGYGARQGRPATGVHQDMWVKAVAFAVAGRTGVLVTADALIIPGEVGDPAVRQLREARGLPREAVYQSATHTHSGLGAWGQGFVVVSFAGAREQRGAPASLAGAATVASGAGHVPPRTSAGRCALAFDAVRFQRRTRVGRQGGGQGAPTGRGGDQFQRRLRRYVIPAKYYALDGVFRERHFVSESAENGIVNWALASRRSELRMFEIDVDRSFVRNVLGSQRVNTNRFELNPKSP